MTASIAADPSTAPSAPASMAAPSILGKAFDVLGSLGESRRELTLSEVARRSGLPKSTAHRILTMLVEFRAVERVGHGYRLGLRMFTMGTSSIEVELRDLAVPHLHRLRRMTGHTVHLAVRDGADVVYLEKLLSPASPVTPAVVGGKLPVHATAVGKAILAFSGRADQPPALGSTLSARTSVTVTDRTRLLEALNWTRRHGVAIDREEASRGLACLAAPVLVNRRAVGAISVAFPAQAGSGEAFAATLRETAATIARAAAATPSFASLAC